MKLFLYFLLAMLHIAAVTTTIIFMCNFAEARELSEYWVGPMLSILVGQIGIFVWLAKLIDDNYID